MRASLGQVGDKFTVELDKSIDEIYGGRVYLEILKPDVKADGLSFTIPIGEDALMQYQVLTEILEKKMGFQIVADSNTQGILQRAEKERHSFLLFSEAARKIRNDECDPDDFTQFKKRTSELKVQLKIFQLLSGYHLSFAQNACNFSVPGSGKTIAVYSAYNYLKSLAPEDLKRIDKLVVVGPLSCFKSWKDDYSKAFGLKPKYLEIYGGISKGFVSAQLNSTVTDYNLILVNYHSLSRYLDELVAFMKLHKTMLVLDEAHKIKKIDDGLWSTSALRLSSHPFSRVVLTGTPAPNGYEDIYNLYRFIWPSKNIIGYSPGQLMAMSSNASDSRTEDLQQRIEPFFVRTTKKQLDLPTPKFVPPVEVRMGKLQQIIYDALNQKTPGLEKDAKNNPSVYQSRLIRLRQAASNPDLLNAGLADYYKDLDGDYVHKVRLVDDLNLPPHVTEIVKSYSQKEVPAKFKKALELCQQLVADKQKVIIWCEFIGNIENLSRYLTEHGVTNSLLYGAIENQEREAIINQFHTDDKLSVIIANPHAVGESISLHMACHNAIYLEQSFNAATYMQSKDRIHRLGLSKDVVTKYFFLHSIGTVDEVIHGRVLEKEEKMIGIVESKDIPLFTNNTDYMDDTQSDLKALIRHYYETTNQLV